MRIETLIKDVISLGLEAAEAELISTAPSTTEVADDAIEVTELFNTVSSTSAELERLETAADALDRIVEESQGITILATDLPVTNVAVETIGRQLGIEGLGLEGVHETLLRVWESIKDFIKKLVAAVSNFFASIFGAFKKLKARAAKLKAEANSASPDKDLNGKLKHPTYISQLIFEKKADAGSIIEGLRKSDKDIKQTFIEVKRCAGGIAVGMARSGAALSEGESTTGVNIGFVNDFATTPFSGGYQVSPSKAGTNVQIFFDITHAKETYPAGTEVDKANRRQVVEIAGLVDHICTTATDKKETVDNIKRVYNEIITKTDNLMKENQHKGPLSRSFALRHHNFVGKLAMSNYSKTLTEISKVAFNISRAALQYGEASIA